MIRQMFEEERGNLVHYVGPFDGFHCVPASVSKTCTVRFDNAAQKQDLSREARAARATTMAAAEEAGVSGLSVDALLADVYGKEATAKDRISQNTGFTTTNLTREMDGLRTKAKDRINSMP